MKINFSEYTIVYEAGKPYTPFAREASYSLRQRMEKAYGCAPAVSENATAAKTISFLRGDEDKPNLCSVTKKGENYFLRAASSSGYDRVIELFLSGEEFEDGRVYDADAADRSLAKEYGELRVIFHNIFGYDREPTINSSLRFRFQTLLYREYKAPLLCLQEYDVEPRRLMAPLLSEAGYREVEVDFSALGKNCSPIFYDPARLSLIDRGYHPFFYVSPVNPAVCNNANTKNITWAVFDDQQTGKRFAVISLHFYYSADAAISKERVERAESNLARIKNAEEMMDVIKHEILAKHPDLPILFGGDTNACYIHGTLESVLESVTKGETVLDYLRKEGAVAAKDSAEIFADSHTTIHAYPTYDQTLGYYDTCADPTDTSFDRAIDHVYTYGKGMKVQTFDILDSSFACKTSDHCPIVIDLLLD